MKKIILTTAICLTQIATFSQGLHVTDDKLDKQVLAVSLNGPAMATVEMQKELLLDDAQYVQVTQLNQDRYEQLEKAADTFAQDPIQRSRAMRDINLENDKALRQVLTQTQLRYFLELEGRQNARFVTENDK
ncbi:hypothetical protein I2I11_15760 [Pontibacter sp. 172403-2]|uniref:hypothetical protein n=1 Tax=Pontibacter rufus TaxID=2791028 RepID=UPI0018AFE9AA|nr:hypothetical protein [Pontibacter sp. 172403-2]MBF9254761.1 hypothetical protein [Pontibacter sp. 172403-2]